MFILFCVLQAVIQGFAWGVLIWLCATSPGFVQTSSYPLIDFAFKTRDVSASLNAAHSQDGSYLDRNSATATGDSSIRQLLKDRKIVMSRIEPKVELGAVD